MGGHEAWESSLQQLEKNPGEADDSEHGGEHVSEDGGEGIACGEVGVEATVLPVGHPGHHDSLKVLQDLLEVFALLGSLRQDQTLRLLQ